MVHMCKMIISLVIVFSFSKFSFSRSSEGSKGKNGLKWWKCLSHLIIQEPYIIWSSFMAHMFKRKIFLDLFSFFQNFGFRDHLGVKRAIRGLKWQKSPSVSLCISGTVHHMIVTLVSMWKTMISPAVFPFLEHLIF